MRPAVRVDDPRVLVGELHHDDGTRFTWFVSRHPEPLAVQPEVDGQVLVDEAGVAVLERRAQAG